MLKAGTSAPALSAPFEEAFFRSWPFDLLPEN
jgi:hypothetical protein